MGRREAGVGCDPAPPLGEVSHGRWRQGQRPPLLNLAASRMPPALIRSSVLPPLLLPRELSSQGSFAELCLFGIPG